MMRFTAIVALFVVGGALAQPPGGPSGGPALGTEGPNSNPVCATDGTTANIQFSVSSSNRVISTNLCPNHAIRTINPNAAHENNYFGISNQQYPVPLTPTLAPTGQTINATCLVGMYGIARSGAAIYSVSSGTCGGDAVALEGFTFDECGGHSDQSGEYHYHMTPTCVMEEALASNSAHSPILGYMMDGIPMYGPLGANGKVPTDLDQCGGHSSDGGNNGQYHYHTKPITGVWPDPATPLQSFTTTGAGWPYMPGCLAGCVPDIYTQFWSQRYGTTIPYSSYAACVASGGKTLTNVESITSPVLSGAQVTTGAIVGTLPPLPPGVTAGGATPSGSTTAPTPKPPSTPVPIAGSSPWPTSTSSAPSPFTGIFSTAAAVLCCVLLVAL